ncbi:hypothetical protein ACWGH4_13955, partial [Streptomyces sp. NPDC054847]
CLRPGWPRPAARYVLRATEGKPAVAGAVGSTTLASHFGASLEDHGPNVVLYRAGPQTARRAGSYARELLEALDAKSLVKKRMYDTAIAVAQVEAILALAAAVAEQGIGTDPR